MELINRIPEGIKVFLSVIGICGVAIGAGQLIACGNDTGKQAGGLGTSATTWSGSTTGDGWKPQPLCDYDIPWTEAEYHVGEVLGVKGPVVGSYFAAEEDGEPTFLDIGQDYPSPNGVAAVIWIESRGNFPPAPEAYYLGEEVSVTGQVTLYDGSPQIEVSNSSQIELC